MYRLLLVDDDKAALDVLRRDVASLPCQAEAFSQPRLALARAQVVPFDLLITDYQMPDMDGVTLAKTLKSTQPKLLAIVLSGLADLRTVMAADAQGRAYRYLVKPWDAGQLHDMIRQAMTCGTKTAQTQATPAVALPGSVAKGALAALEQKYPGVSVPGSGWKR